MIEATNEQKEQSLILERVHNLAIQHKMDKQTVFLYKEVQYSLLTLF